MIQIQRQQQFENAAARCRKERMFVRQAGWRRYFVTNQSKGRTYEVFFSQLNGKRFGTCNCEAGTPMHGNRVPMVCKHLAAALSLHLALAAHKQTSH